MLRCDKIQYKLCELKIGMDGRNVLDTVEKISAIKDKQYTTIIHSKEYQQLLEGMSRRIVNKSKIAPNGTKGCFVMRKEEKIYPEHFSDLSSSQLDRFIQYAIRLNLKALNSKNLVDSFCNSPENDGIAFQLVKVLYQNLSDFMIPKTKMLYNEWKELFRLAHDTQSDSSKQQAMINRKQSLESLLEVTLDGNNEEYCALFALQTAYAIIVKIVAYRIVSIVRYKSSFIDFERLVGIESEAMRQHLSSLEEGAVFRDYGITNLLEGDFFSWYTSKGQWTDAIAKKLSDVFRMLNMYSDKAVLNTGSGSSDFFKELYQGMIPSAVRHSLGEYYTKQWLASQVVKDALEQVNISNWRGLE